MLNKRNDWFYHFVKIGALDDITPIKAVILNNQGKCCGYVTFRCLPISVALTIIDTNPSSRPYLKEKINSLLLQMKEKTHQFGICFHDISYENLGIHNNKCYYYDLDGVWNIKDFQKTYPKTWKSALVYLNLKN